MQTSKAHDRLRRPGASQRRKHLHDAVLSGIAKIALNRTPPLNLASEAHLAPSKRTMTLVRYMPTEKRRSHTGRAVFLGCLLLNELRGLFVVAAVLKAWHG